MTFTRDSGILLHLTSLPNKYGSGDLGKSAYEFVDWLKLAGQNYWQILPIVNIDKNNSPYTSTSAFAGNILLIDLEDLQQKNYLSEKDLSPPNNFNSANHQINYPKVRKWRMKNLEKAAKSFFIKKNPAELTKFKNFCKKEAIWLNDYAIFTVLSDYFKQDWVFWPKKYAARDINTIKATAEKFAKNILFQKFYQWCFFEQWQKLYKYAADNKIKIIGDMPIYVSMNSADVWTHKKLFKLDNKFQPNVVAGVPPDYFSEDGQRWGNPVYDWTVNKKNRYKWWISRLQKNFHTYNLLRLDHFLGYTRYWEIPTKEPNAINGNWRKGPQDHFFQSIKNHLFPEVETMPLIAEDLGAYNPQSDELRKKYQLPGMRVLQFAWGSGNDNIHLPHNHSQDSIAYTGTHDNDTIIGWYHQIDDWQRGHLHDYLQYFDIEHEKINWRLIRACMESKSIIAIFPLQDVLGLDSKSRMNIPGVPEGNWQWRFNWNQITPEITDKLKELTINNNR